MGLVTRPTKTGGNTTYVAEVAGGNVTIKAAEVDADFNALITGGINNVETANINIAGLGTAALANLSVTTPKLAVGAAVDAAVTAASDDESGGSFTAETTVVTLPSITVRGGRVLIMGSWSLYVALAAGGGGLAEGTIRIRVKRGGVTQHTVDHKHNVSTTSGGASAFAIPIPPVFWSEVPAAGSYVYTITIERVTVVAGSVAITGLATNVGAYFAWELA